MKTLILILHLTFCILPFASAQQYEWVDLSANIHDSNYIQKALRDIHFIGLEGWITGQFKSELRVYHTTDGGPTFIAQTVPANSGNGMSVAMRSPMEGYIVTSAGHVLRTTDGGNNWITISMPGGSLYSISFPPLPEPTGYICGNYGRIYSVTGSTLASETTIGTATLTSISCPVNSNEGWVCGGTVIRHRNSTGWHIDQNDNGGKYYCAIYFIDNQHGWAVGSDGIIIRTINGIDWITQTNPDNNQLNDVFFLNTQEGWAVGDNVILHTNDGGVTWIKEPTSLTDSTLLLSVFAVNNNEVYVTGRKYGPNLNRSLLLKYTIVTGIQENTAKESVILFQNQPNPFSNSTVIWWQILVGNHVVLRVFDFMGKEIKTLVDADMAPGEHQVSFDASGLPAGVYFYRLQANGTTETKKMVVTNE